jgi:hypothetical protein
MEALVRAPELKDVATLLDKSSRVLTSIGETRLNPVGNRKNVLLYGLSELVGQSKRTMAAKIEAHLNGGFPSSLSILNQPMILQLQSWEVFYDNFVAWFKEVFPAINDVWETIAAFQIGRIQGSRINGIKLALTKITQFVMDFFFALNDVQTKKVEDNIIKVLSLLDADEGADKRIFKDNISLYVAPIVFKGFTSLASEEQESGEASTTQVVRKGQKRTVDVGDLQLAIATKNPILLEEIITQGNASKKNKVSTGESIVTSNPREEAKRIEEEIASSLAANSKMLDEEIIEARGESLQKKFVRAQPPARVREKQRLLRLK